MGSDISLAALRRGEQAWDGLDGQADGPDGETPPTPAADPVARLGGVPGGRRTPVDDAGQVCRGASGVKVRVFATRRRSHRYSLLDHSAVFTHGVMARHTLKIGLRSVAEA